MRLRSERAYTPDAPTATTVTSATSLSKTLATTQTEPGSPRTASGLAPAKTLARSCPSVRPRGRGLSSRGNGSSRSAALASPASSSAQRRTWPRRRTSQRARLLPLLRSAVAPRPRWSSAPPLLERSSFGRPPSRARSRAVPRRGWRSSSVGRPPRRSGRRSGELRSPAIDGRSDLSHGTLPELHRTRGTHERCSTWAATFGSRTR